MRISLVQIGNSQGFRLPKAVIDQAQLRGELELEVKQGEILIRAIHSVREGWAQDAADCRAQSGDELVEWDSTINDFDGDWQ
jgi:antitoxin MazE